MYADCNAVDQTTHADQCGLWETTSAATNSPSALALTLFALDIMPRRFMNVCYQLLQSTIKRRNELHRL